MSEITYSCNKPNCFFCSQMLVIEMQVVKLPPVFAIRSYSGKLTERGNVPTHVGSKATDYYARKRREALLFSPKFKQRISA